MNKLLTGLSCATLLLSSALASANQDLPEADLELLLNFKNFCQEIANDDGTGDLSLQAYLLECVNEELVAEGYQAITELPE
jgi:hypothetical protein